MPSASLQPSGPIFLSPSELTRRQEASGGPVTPGPRGCASPRSADFPAPLAETLDGPARTSGCLDRAGESGRGRRGTPRESGPGHRRAAAGYSALELMVAMAISAILAGISLPNMLNVIQAYSADGAARQVMADLRYAQTQAVSRGMQARLVIFNANGVATGSGYANDATRANKYRLEARPTGGAWPAVTDTMASNANVLTPWVDLGVQYRQGVTQANAVAFTSRSSLQNSAATLNIVLQTLPAGRGHTVATNPTGKVTIQ